MLEKKPASTKQISVRFRLNPLTCKYLHLLMPLFGWMAAVEILLSVVGTDDKFVCIFIWSQPIFSGWLLALIRIACFKWGVEMKSNWCCRERRENSSNVTSLPLICSVCFGFYLIWNLIQFKPTKEKCFPQYFRSSQIVPNQCRRPMPHSTFNANFVRPFKNGFKI